MNPLTRKATHNVNRENDLIAWGCGVVLAVLFVSFFL